MAVTLVSTKLHTPPVRSELVSRPRLLALLDQGLHRKLTLVSAPAGFGKTTLLGEWTHRLAAGSQPRTRVAWISLDEGDNDPVRFAAYLAAALRPEDGPGPAGGDAPEPAGAWLQESHVGRLVNEVAAQPQDVVLVLDDYHLITTEAIHAAVAFLLEHLPPTLRLVLATRADPPLPLPRLRARDHLAELRQEDLRFTAQEAAAFLNQVVGLDLSAADVAALEARTEGWIAGLQMAALSLQGHSPQSAARSEFVRSLTGSHRFILDYLVEEVLEQQHPALQEFLLHTSILERLCGPLCDALLEALPGRPPSQQVLERLESANLFIVPLDDERRWYRYHRLFADLLRKRLGQESSELLPALHRRASAWHEEQGLMPQAIEHALAGRDFERAAALLEENAEATLMRSELATFLGWVARLPDGWARRRPKLSFYHAWALLMSGRSLDVVEKRMQELARVADTAEDGGVMAGRLAALRAYLMLFRVDMRRATELCRLALERLPESDRFLRAVVTWILSLADLARGEAEDGSRALEGVAWQGHEAGNPLIAVAALCHQARLQTRQGHLHRAREILERALRWATDPQGQWLPIASEALIGLGDLEREWNQLEAAADHLAESIDLARQWSELSAFDAYFPLARTRLAQGDLEGARQALDTARQLARRSRMTALDDLMADLQDAYFCTVTGDAAGSERWAERRGLLPGASPPSYPALVDEEYIVAHLLKYEQMVLARLFLLRERPAAALDLLEPLLAQARQLGRVDLSIEIQILRALAWRQEGDETQALDALAEALSLAEPGGWQRIFLDEGQALTGLLHRATSRGVAPAYVAGLLAALGEPEAARGEAGPWPSPATPLLEPLSERELEVLRLLAAGLSNPEIAERLVVAVSTVRSHCKSIYGKLGVHRRWDAVQRARALGLIETAGT